MQEVTVVPQKSTVRRGWARCAEGTHSSLELAAWQPCWLIPSAAGVLSCPVLPRQPWPSCCSHASALAWEPRLTGSTDWPPLAQSNVCVHFRKQSRSWRRPESFPLQGVLTPDFCVKCHQISHAQPRTKQGQALSGGLILHPFNQISRTQAGRRGGSRAAIPELQVLGNWDVNRREKGTVKQQFWWFLSAFDVIFFSFLFCSRVLKIDSLTNAYSNSVVLNI